MLAWRRASACLPTDSLLPGAAPCPPEASHPSLDVVSVAAKPTCVTRLAVAALNQYVGPRRIVFVSSNDVACARLTSFADNVECVPEDDLIPGVTKAAVDAELARLYGGTRGRARQERGERRRGQPRGQIHIRGGQLHGQVQRRVVPAAARQARRRAVPPRAQRHVLNLGPDMIPLWPVRVFGAQASAANGGKQRAFRQNRWVRDKSLRVLLRKARAGRTRSVRPDGSSYVTHQMVVERAYVEELLGAFGEAWERRLSMESAVKASAAYGCMGGEWGEWGEWGEGSSPEGRSGWWGGGF